MCNIEYVKTHWNLKCKIIFYISIKLKPDKKILENGKIFLTILKVISHTGTTIVFYMVYWNFKLWKRLPHNLCHKFWKRSRFSCFSRNDQKLCRPRLAEFSKNFSFLNSILLDFSIGFFAECLTLQTFFKFLVWRQNTFYSL